jgi:rod shape-determining protein MreC
MRIRPIFSTKPSSHIRVILLLVLALTLMVFDKRAAMMGRVRMILSLPLMPLQYVVSWPIDCVNSIYHSVDTHHHLVQENADLKLEQLKWRAQAQRLAAQEIENSQLKGLRRVASTLQSRFLVAQLLSVSSGVFSHQVVLDRGSHDHVFVGQPVLDADGVMGQVVEVGLFNSRVLLVNDPRSGVSVQVARNGVRSIVVGDASSGKLRLLNVLQTADIQIGDTLITSGLGQYYPAGYPVGRVDAIKKEPGAAFVEVDVSPAAHLDSSRAVILIWSK